MKVDTLILGAGAAGMMAATQTGGATLIVDHAARPGEKIRISGGGRCNFTNYGVEAGCFLSENPHFAKSALSRYTQWDFIDLIDRHGIAWHEKTLGQLFCDGKATQIVDMLRTEMTQAGAEFWLSTEIGEVHHDGTHFVTTLTRDGRPRQVAAHNLILATGGLSIPKMGATGLAYRIARQFDHEIVPTRPALVPFTFTGAALEPLAALAGVAAPARVTTGGTSFDEALLFTHRGLSGPAVLQTSSYWAEGQPIRIDLDPEDRIRSALRHTRQTEGRKSLSAALAPHLPQRLIAARLPQASTTRIGDQSDQALSEILAQFRDWHLTPAGTEGYRTAEVTAGGIATDGLSSKSMESRTVPGLYAIGEAVDVTGWLGGYNFQWAWSSGWAAGRAIGKRRVSP
ncbi:NAD(P)/FAD-dependent oxidoreductase [Palleronia caenipelagi]|uniref:Aminoacetone oxidase family FAD-binding enzyme n=1 Tax=Palleronia caenipelagi TaxID=2489174 RepID=A0A547PY31_9RHOB|nr:aminoacetone oxidase family FAD-binding enzyme [Palleronia caenipelagi]TRD19016.1 aminoacetone oxidase family FAD-binding enzyme [Palleronia caenipelagi]